MSEAHDFKLALTRVIEPAGGPGAELATLEDAARFVGLMRPWRQARPHWDFAAELLLKAAQTRGDKPLLNERMGNRMDGAGCSECLTCQILPELRI